MMRRWSIAGKIAALIFAALALLTAANFFITFAGPPPRPAPAQVADLIVAMKTGAGRHLLVEDGAADFAPRSGEDRRVRVEQRLSGLFGTAPGRLRFASDQPLQGGPDGLGPNVIVGGFSLGLQDGAGRWRIIRSAPQPLLTAWHRTTIAITIGLTLLLGFVAARITQDIVRPIQRLAREADQAWLEGPRGEITVDGPPEVAHLARTIAAMRDRFAGMVENRTMMLAAIAHDMATPLSRLEFHVARLPEDRRGQAEADLAELSGLIASILGYAKGQQRLDRQPVELVELVRDILARHERADAPVPLVEAPGEAWLLGDRLALMRLIGNLVNNAQRYAGGGRVTIRLADAAVVLILADDGTGFDPALAERLFDPFFRVESSRSRDTAGTGLGLATARAIAEAHEGTLTARSEGGATFVLSLPVMRVGS